MLYEVDLVCRRYSLRPTTVLGFDRIFSDSVCFDLDVVVAQFGIQTDNRMQAEEKRGGKWQKKYGTMAEVLGITQDEWSGGLDQQTLEDSSEAYIRAAREAMRKGETMPDVDTWLASHAEEGEPDDE